MKIVKSTRINDKIISDWTVLWRQSDSANYFNSPYWFISLIENHLFSNYLIIMIYDQQNLKGLVYLINHKRFGVETFSIIPSNYVSGSPFLVETNNEQVLKKIIDSLLTVGNVIFDNIPEDLINLFTPTFPKLLIIEQDKNYILKFKNQNGQVIIRKKEKYLKYSRDILNSLSLKTFYGWNYKVFQAVLNIDKHSRKKYRSYETFSEINAQRLYKSLAKNFKTYFQTNLLFHDDLPIAYEIGFCIRSSYFGSLISSREDYSSYSIGRVLMIRLIEKLAEKKVKIFDFGSGEDHVKRSLTKEYQHLYTIVIPKNNFAKGYFGIIFKIKKLIISLLHNNKEIYSSYRKIRELLLYRS